MDTLAFLRRILPSNGVYLMGTPTQNNKFAHYGYDSIEELANAVATFNKTSTVYHACAAYLRKPYLGSDGKYVTRKAENWATAKSFWVDVDCGEEKARKGEGYLTKQEAFTAIKGFLAKHDLPAPLIVSSGYGFHLYWTLTKEIPAERWVATAKILKTVLANDGVLQDPSRTADFASVLRPVGSTNRKYGGEVPVTCVYESEDIDTEEFIAKIESLKPVDPLGAIPSFLEGAVDVNEVIEKHHVEYDYEAPKLAENCAQVKFMRDTQGDVSYEVWRGVIGLLTFCKDGEKYAEEWSARRGDTGHAQVDFQMKFNTWSSKPTRCEHFQHCNPELCKNCPHEKVGTPLTLARVMPEQQTVQLPERKPEVIADAPVEKPQSLEEAEDGLNLPPGYKWTGQYLVRYAENNKGEVVGTKFCSDLFYITGRVRGVDGRYANPIIHFLPDGTVSEFDLPTEYIGAGNSVLLRELASHELTTTPDKGADEAMSAYLKDLLQDTKRKVATTLTFTTFGWQGEKESFLIGDRLYQPNGKVTRVLLRGYAQSRQDMYPAPCGTIEGYAKSINWIYNRPGMEPMQYAIASLWGAPLAPLVDTMYKGIPCALTGTASGKGKTTAFTAALYAFGDATKATIASETGGTAKAKLALMGAVANLPVLFDEFTNISAKEMSVLAYSLANGSDVVRLQVKKNEGVSFADAAQWNTQTGLTGNSNLIAKLSTKGQSEAEAMRLFEIQIDNHKIPSLSPSAVAMQLGNMKENMGVAGEAFIQYVVSNLDEVRQMLAETAVEVTRDSSIATEPKYRFYRYHMICTITAAKIMKSLGACAFDIDKMIEFARGTVVSICDEVTEQNMTTPEEILSRYIIDNMGGTLITSALKVSGPVQPPRETMVSRAVISNGGATDGWNNRYMTVGTKFSQWCNENRISTRQTLDQLESAGYLIDRSTRVVLTSGTNLPSVRTRGHIFDIAKLGDLDLGVE